jgi:hypothetical protein
MTLRLSLLGSALALSLAAGGAYAETYDETPPADTTPAEAAQPPVNAPTDATGAPMQAPTGVPANVADTSSSTTTTMPNGATLTHTVVTNGPVADTPENRRLYGQPLSHAGRRTAPAGN